MASSSYRSVWVSWPKRDTNVALAVSADDTIGSLKTKLEQEVPATFRKIGEIEVKYIKMERNGCCYPLFDSMLISSVLEEARGVCFLQMEATVLQGGGDTTAPAQEKKRGKKTEGPSSEQPSDNLKTVQSTGDKSLDGSLNPNSDECIKSNGSDSFPNLDAEKKNITDHCIPEVTDQPPSDTPNLLPKQAKASKRNPNNTSLKGGTGSSADATKNDKAKKPHSGKRAKSLADMVLTGDGNRENEDNAERCKLVHRDMRSKEKGDTSGDTTFPTQGKKRRKKTKGLSSEGLSDNLKTVQTTGDKSLDGSLNPNYDGCIKSNGSFIFHNLDAEKINITDHRTPEVTDQPSDIPNLLPQAKATKRNPSNTSSKGGTSSSADATKNDKTKKPHSRKRAKSLADMADGNTEDEDDVERYKVVYRDKPGEKRERR